MQLCYRERFRDGGSRHVRIQCKNDRRRRRCSFYRTRTWWYQRSSAQNNTALFSCVRICNNATLWHVWTRHVKILCSQICVYVINIHRHQLYTTTLSSMNINQSNQMAHHTTTTLLSWSSINIMSVVALGIQCTVEKEREKFIRINAKCWLPEKTITIQTDYHITTIQNSRTTSYWLNTRTDTPLHKKRKISL